MPGHPSRSEVFIHGSTFDENEVQLLVGLRGLGMGLVRLLW